MQQSETKLLQSPPLNAKQASQNHQAETNNDQPLEDQYAHMQKKELIRDFSLEAIWAEMDRIKQQRIKVDSTYQKIMRQLKSPDPSASKKGIRNCKSTTTFAG